MRIAYVSKGGVPKIEEVDACERDLDTLRFFTKNSSSERVFVTSVHTPRAKFLYEQMLHEGYIDLTKTFAGD